MNELIAITENSISGQQVQTVNARELHEFLDVGKRFTTWIQDRIEQYGFVENMDFLPILGKSSGGRPSTEYHITIDMAKELSMVERNENGKQARQYFIECERLAKENTPSLPKDYATALRVLADEVEQKELALLQRDEAHRTKAYISNKKTATAMATASTAVRKQRRLENELGRGENYKSARSVPWISEYFEKSRGMWIQVGKKLKSISDEMGIPPLELPDSKYGHVNGYNIDVIDKLRARLDADDNMLWKYRKKN